MSFDPNIHVAPELGSNSSAYFSQSNWQDNIWQKKIDELFPCDWIVAIDDDGNPAPGRVVRLFRNITETFLSLTFLDASGALQHLTVTPGHRFATPDGDWVAIGDMVRRCRDRLPAAVQSDLPAEERLSEHAIYQGVASIVLEDGTVTEAAAYRLDYCAATAGLFEQGEMVATPSFGSLAVAPAVKRGWKTYNFEVETHHNYIAGGVRVHNDSTIATGLFGPNAINAASLGLFGVEATGAVLSGKISAQFGVDSYAYSASMPGAVVGYDASTGWTSLTNPTGVSTLSITGTGLHAVTWDPPFGYDSGAPSGSVGGGSVGAGWGGAIGAVSTLSDGGYEQSYGTGSAAGGAAIGGSGESGGKPIMIDLNGDGVEVLTADDNLVLFDVDDDGFLERTSWVAADDAFLMLDEGGDGDVGAAREIIFSRWLDKDVDLSALYDDPLIAAMDADNDGTVSLEEAVARQAAAGQIDEADTNGDGVIDREEALAFVDANGDGIHTDLQVMATLFDTNRDGTLNAADATWLNC